MSNSTVPFPYQINYAKYFGVTEAPAIAITIIFAFFFVLCLVYAYRYREDTEIRWIFPYLSLFSGMRVVAFALRSDFASDGTNLTLYIVQQCFYAAGLFALINVSYMLLKNWFTQAKEYFSTSVQGRIEFITRSSRFVLIAAVALGVTGGVMANPLNSASTLATGVSLTKASRWLYFALTAIFFLVAAISTARLHLHATSPSKDRSTVTQNVGILVLIGALLNIKTVFNVAALSNTTLTSEETYFYPLSVMPELLVLVVYCLPTVVTRFKSVVSAV